MQIQYPVNFIVTIVCAVFGTGIGFAAGYAYKIKHIWVYPLLMTAISVYLCACCDTLAACIWGAVFAAVVSFFSTKDVLCREVNDWMHLLIFLLGCFWLSASTWRTMLVGALVCGAPFLLAALLKSGSIGGADIKCMAAIGWALGWEKGLLTLFFGCLFSVVGAGMVGVIRHKKIRSVPMVPIFCASALLTYGVL